MLVSGVIITLGFAAPGSATAATTPPPVLHVSAPQLINPAGGGQITAPSCPTTTFCVAGEPTGDVQTWNGSTWSAPVLVDRTDPNDNPQLTVSCPTTTLCVGVDVAAHAFVWRGLTWSGPSTIDDATGDGIQQLSCASATFCAALDWDSRLIVFNGTSWAAPAPTGIQLNPHQLSCTAPTFCMILNNNDTYVFNGTNWRGPISIAKHSQATVWTDISCASATICYASEYEGKVALFNGTRWKETGEPVTGMTLGSIQCPAVKFCAVAGSYPSTDSDAVYLSMLINGAWSTPLRLNSGTSNYAGVTCRSSTFCIANPGGDIAVTAAHTTVWDGTKWLQPNMVPTRIGGGFDRISCVGITFCVAVDSDGVVQTYRNGSWAAPTLIDPVWDGLRDVSCASTTFCIAVDGQGSAMRFNGSAWTGPTPIDNQELSAVDCPTTTFCMVTSWGGDVITLSGTTWSTPHILDPLGNVAAVSCPTTTFCAANDQYGNVMTYNGTSWTAPKTIAQHLTDVSFPTTTFCAVGVGALDGEAAFYNGTTWTRPTIIDPGHDIDLVTCASSSMCIATDGNYELVSFNTTGARAAIPLTPPGPSSIRPAALTCPTTTNCTLTYNHGTIAITT